MLLLLFPTFNHSLSAIISASRGVIPGIFVVNSRAVLLYDSNFIPTILRIEIENELLAKQGKKITFSLENINGEEVVILS